MTLLAFLAIGLLAGFIARALVPGRQSMGLLGTFALGIVGSFIGGWVSLIVYARNDWTQLHPSGIVFSVIGAGILLLAITRLERRVRT